MAEIKNAFIKSKMNKDLDSRLIPNGEYRDAKNVQVSRSQGEDVGALENILGNAVTVNGNFALDAGAVITGSDALTSSITAPLSNGTAGTYNPTYSGGSGSGLVLSATVTNATTVSISVTASGSGYSVGDVITINSNQLGTGSSGPAITLQASDFNIECIGYVVDQSSSFVYLFFTNYTDPYAGDVSKYSTTAKNFIYAYNILTGERTKLLQGAFLNFSTNKPIIGVNLLENLLFWTDDRNQPRKINTSIARSNGVSYYNSEDKISVAKYNPYESIELLGLSTITSTTTTAAITDSNTFAVASASGIVIDKVVTGTQVKANTYVTAINGLNITVNKPQTIPSGATVNFAYPETTMYNVSNEFLPPQSNAFVNGAVNNDDTFDIDNTRGAIATGLFVSGEGVVANTTVLSYNVTSKELEVSSSQTLGDNTKLSFSQKNPYYNANFSGDPQYLEDKFVRFSYRFKFIDGEYSLIAPFTQAAFIPKQDGYFLDGDEDQTVASTIVEFMENKVDKIDLQIPLPSSSNNLESSYLITDIDIIYKESDSNTVQVVETIPVSSISGSSSTYIYTYTSQKPYKTLPSDEIIRVYDKIPVKALGQEIISNRVVYSNFQNKHTPPNFIDYQVSVGDKLPYSITGSAKSTVEYPNHNVKENRNYQVGVVLADRFGRQSTVILSNNTSNLSSGFGSDTVYLPYNSTNNSITFVGNSIKTKFNTVFSGVGFDKNEINGIPGLYNGDAASPDYNPLGWYSYKIVIKQNEQEYYNVYAPSAMKGMPYYTGSISATNPSEQNASFITLINDNINKVPRDLTEVGPQDKQFRSSAVLFGRVDLADPTFSPGTYPGKNAQYFPGRRSFTTNTIENLFDLFDVADFDATGSSPPITNPNNPYYSFFRSESNPFIAELITSQDADAQFGAVNSAYTNSLVYTKFDNLSILETKPVTSRLDIYWETSTSGLVSELNEAINQGSTQAALISGWAYDHTEASSPGDVISGPLPSPSFAFKDILGGSISSIYSVTMSVTNGANEDVTSRFSLIRNTPPSTNNSFKVQTASGEYFYYDTNNLKNIFNFVFSVTISDGDPASNVSKLNQSLTNIVPIISNNNNDTIMLSKGARDVPLAGGTPTGKATGVNGSNPAGGKSTDNLIFSISAQSGAGSFQIDTTDGISVINTNGTSVGDGTFQLKLEDGGSPSNLSVTKTFNVNFEEVNDPEPF